MSSVCTSQDLYFPSKRDWWIVGLIWASVVVSVVGGLIPLMLGEISRIDIVLGSVFLIGIDGLMLWVLYGTGYTVTPDRLLIRCGPFSFRLLLNTIESISPSRSLWSSPACSLDRLMIVYGVSRQRILVSPKDKVGFLRAIVKQCPSLINLHNQVQRKVSEPSSSVEATLEPPSHMLVP